MSTINGLLNTGRSALLSHQLAISVTGHNIANANTEGYTRQRVVLEASQPIAYTSTGSPGMVGTGVQAESVERMQDQFLLGQITGAASELGRWQAQQGAMEQVEIVFNESSGFGLDSALSDYWNAWQDLSVNPSGNPERQVLVSKAEILASTFNEAANQLQTIQQDTDLLITSTVDEVNRIADQISDLNAKIQTVQRSGQNANDYLDQRDQLLHELASRIDITSTVDDDGVVTVTLGDGHQLVGSTPFGRLATTTHAATGMQDIVWDSAPATVINADIGSGKLHGLLEVRDTLIPGDLGRLDTLAGTLMTEVNTLHSAGVGLNDTVGRVFFTGTGAADMALNPELAADVSRIAAAADATGVPGDNSNAIAMANLAFQLTMDGNTTTFAGYYQATVSSVGLQVQESKAYTDHSQTLADYLESYRQSISGVSLDEEMVHLVEFQHAYDAAAKLISIVDEMMTTIIEML
jgi:flagellar hook-associated protein 1 FlgK